ncbi:MAG: selenocysteine-specific translation elongation factor [Planctomycetales bacterium]|nr:selenocysteine-specific translation elongation factor [bacterium]UNM07783.1 MAG: selenocysteine-specific translation elongation factor [Planctomycetales bacterium]
MAEPRYLVLGTSGHIDHGKTSLVRALTGVDTDTLEEEKRRGITINLGFAHLELGDELRIGIIDVPGHARFIRNMVAGATGIDLLLLVIAADDGVMPQTTEHLHIARMLGVRHGLVALTKVDMVEEEIRELAIEDIREVVSSTFLEGCPIVPVSSIKGIGMDELKEQIRMVAMQVPQRASEGRFRMAIDRAFSIHGAGTVVTGTTVSGNASVDDELMLYPSGKRVRVRGIQMHGEDVRNIGAGMRAAINLAGVSHDEISRGEVLAEKDALESSFMLDAEVELLDGAFTPLRRGSEVELHIGTVELTAKVHPLDSDLAIPGSTSLVQLRVSEPLAIAAGDRFILRASTGQQTIGGGVVLDPHPTKHRRRRGEAAEKLEDLREESLEARLLHEVGKSQYGANRQDLLPLLLVDDTTLEAAIQAALKGGLQAYGSGRSQILSTAENRERIVKRAMKMLEGFHDDNPLTLKGMSVSAFANGITAGAGSLPVELVEQSLNAGVQDGRLLKQAGTFALPGRAVKLTAKDNEALKELRARMLDSIKPDQPDDIVKDVPVDKKRLLMLCKLLAEDGELVVLPGAVYFDTKIVEAIAGRLREHLSGDAQMTVSDFNQFVGTSRKYGIPLLQYFEQSGLLKRDGDFRKLA